MFGPFIMVMYRYAHVGGQNFLLALLAHRNKHDCCNLSWGEKLGFGDCVGVDMMILFFYWENQLR